MFKHLSKRLETLHKELAKLDARLQNPAELVTYADELSRAVEEVGSATTFRPLNGRITQKALDLHRETTVKWGSPERMMAHVREHLEQRFREEMKELVVARMRVRSRIRAHAAMLESLRGVNFNDFFTQLHARAAELMTENPAGV